MKLLWVRRRPVLDGGGDAIVDTKFAQELARTLDVTVYTVERLSRADKLRRSLTRRLPPDRGSFGTERDVERIAALARQSDAVIFSHEQLDALAIEVAGRLDPKPYTGLLLHNVPSDAYPQLSSRPVVGRIAGRFLTGYERRAFRHPAIDDIYTLSHRDARLVAGLSGRASVPVVHPGAPPEVPLHDGAGLRQDLVIIGTFEWFPKHRDMLAFARSYADGAERAWNGQAPPVYLSAGADQAIVDALKARPLESLDFSDGIRFGLVTDRFVSGHKLKVSEYFARNLIPVSFSAIEEDFRFSPAARALISEVGSLEELSARMRAIAATSSDELRSRFLHAKREVLDTMSWTRQAGVLETRIREALDGRSLGHRAGAGPVKARRAGVGEGR